MISLEKFKYRNCFYIFHNYNKAVEHPIKENDGNGGLNMKAKVKATGEIVDVYIETQHGQVENVYKESTLVGGRMWLDDDLVFIKEPVSDDLEEEINEYISILTERNGNFPKLTRLGFRTIAHHFSNWQKEKDIQKACEWLDGVIYNYLDTGSIGDFETLRGVNNEKFIEDFKKAMDE